MKPRHRLLSALAIALLAPAAVAQQAAPAAAMAQQAAKPAKLSTSDRMLLTDALETNQLEIDVSNYAAKQTHSDKVREFAKARVAEHGQLQAQFQKANDGITPTPGPTAQPGINLLGKTGAEFDQAYVGMMVAYDHGLAFKFGAADGPQHGQAIRDMVKATLPTLKRHDAESKALQGTLPQK